MKVSVKSSENHNKSHRPHKRACKKLKQFQQGSINEPVYVKTSVRTQSTEKMKRGKLPQMKAIIQYVFFVYVI